MIGSVRRPRSAVGQGGRAPEIGIPVQRSAPSALAPGMPGGEGRFVVMGAFRTGQSGNIIAVTSLPGSGGAAASHAGIPGCGAGFMSLAWDAVYILPSKIGFR